jgi:DNA repair protein RadD
MQLRPHQELAVNMLRQSISNGNKKIVLAAPCAFGKTLTAGYIISNLVAKGKRALFICDRIKLVQQSLAAFDSLGLSVGVIQGQHERTDYSKPVQIASIQTLARKRHIPHADVIIVDECHIAYRSLKNLMERWNNIIFIGLSATPYSKGLGQVYQDLVVPITAEQLMEQNYLCPVDYYAGESLNTENVKMKSLPTGVRDYDPQGLKQASEEQKETLTGDIIKNWFTYAKGRQTIAFSSSIKHSKYLVDQFRAAGVGAYHIDGYMEDEDRQDLFQAHDNGEFEILSCSQLLSTGYDSPSSSCIIDCKPTKSIINYVQIAGRIMRTAKGKDRAIYLDHAGNVRRHGFAECIVPEALDDGEKKYNEKNQTKEKKEPNVQQCPQCFGEMMGVRCSCGYEIPITKQIQTTNEMLAKMEKSQTKKNNLLYTYEQKQQFLGELYLHAKLKGKSQGWVTHTYKSKFSVFPNKVVPRLAESVSPEAQKHIKHCAIKYAKAMKYAR